MSDQNGRSATAIEIAGIVFDMNRISRKEYFGLMRQIQALQPKDGEEMPEEDADKIQQISGELYAKIITSWPFDAPITAAGYLNLGMMDGQLVDDAFEQLGEKLKEKKLERLSTYLPNTKSPSMTGLSPTNLETSPV